MTDNPYRQVREPFEETDEWTTEAGTRVETGETVLVKPRYITARLPAEVDTVFWDPIGLPGGEHDRGDDGHVCILNVWFTFRPEEGDEYDHMAGKQVKYEAYNLDFCVGSDREIRRDRANCKTAE